MMLARTFGRSDYEQFLAEMPAHTFNRWRELYELDPWDSKRLDLGFASMQATLCNLWSTRRFSWRDFMPQFARKRKRQSTAQMIQILKMAHAAAAGQRNADHK